METKDQERLLQLKVDYLSYMKQITDWFDSSIMLVIYALLMEGSYVTQKQLTDLTGLKQATISETITRLIYSPLGLPIIETHKPGNKKQKFYTCPLEFEEYIQKMFSAGMKAADINIAYLPPLLLRIDTLVKASADVDHVRNFFHFYWNYTNIARDIFSNIDELLAFYFQGEGTKPDFKNYLTDHDYNKQLTEEQKTPLANDSLEQIKMDFLREIMGVESSIGAKKELAVIFLAFSLENEPVTQDDLMRITQYSRTTISDVLSQLSLQNFLNVIKKPNSRKKYYESKLPMKQFMSSRLHLMDYKIQQLKTTLEKKFIPELDKIDFQDDQEEKTRLKNYFQENIRCYQLLASFSSDTFNFIQEYV
ncbi:MAG: hypothetical protein ACW99F_11525 [Candidatus Hodarchaeales archaeon]|jgi:DNA-binding transcriptional regulator GbsR (MarR family)